jgi:hypothetical protein
LLSYLQLTGQFLEVVVPFLKLSCSVWAIQLTAGFLFGTPFPISRLWDATFLGSVRTVTASSLRSFF